MAVVGILLAAGAGRRFGGGKLLHPVMNSAPMAVTSAMNLAPVCDRLIAVVRPDDEPLSNLLSAAGCEVVPCPEAAAGMGHSLSAGVRASPHAAGWIIALADMPFIETQSHAIVVASMSAGASIACTRYRGKRGHPVGFSAGWLSELAALQGDEGARSLLIRHSDLITFCDVEDSGVLRDIDRLSDLESQ